MTLEEGLIELGRRRAAFDSAEALLRDILGVEHVPAPPEKAPAKPSARRVVKPKLATKNRPTTTPNAIHDKIAAFLRGRAPQARSAIQAAVAGISRYHLGEAVRAGHIVSSHTTRRADRRRNPDRRRHAQPEREHRAPTDHADGRGVY